MINQTPLTNSQSAAYNRYKAEVENLNLLRRIGENYRISQRLQGSHLWIKSADKSFGLLLETMGQMVKTNRALVDVANAVVSKVNPHGSIGDFLAQAYEAAAKALSKDYVDVESLASPSPGRYSDHTRPFSIREKLTVVAFLDRMAPPGFSNHGRPSWCDERLAVEVGIRPWQMTTLWPRYGKDD